MKKTILAVLCTASVAACGNKTDANEKNFGAALTQYFDKKGELCLNIDKWPVDVRKRDARYNLQMRALEAAGLVRGEDISVQDTILIGMNLQVRRYTLTEAAKPFVQEKEVASILDGKVSVKRLCWGRKALAKVVKWEGPMKFGEYQEARVIYTYKVDKLADWATKPELQAAFGEVKVILDGAGTKEDRHAIKLTSEGWESNALD